MPTAPIENLPLLASEAVLTFFEGVFPYFVGLLVVSLICGWLVRVFASGRT